MKVTSTTTATAIIVFFYVSLSAAQPTEAVWQTGELTLWNQQHMTGKLAYNWLAEMVMLRLPNGQVRTYSARQVQQFGWFDLSQHKQRDFLSLPVEARHTLLVYSFYEVCQPGKLTVVRRYKQSRGWLSRAFNRPQRMTDTPGLANSIDLFAYFAYSDGALLPFSRFYLDIYQTCMVDYHRELSTYVIDHNLNSQTLPAQLLLTERFNYLSAHQSKTALARANPAD